MFSNVVRLAIILFALVTGAYHLVHGDALGLLYGGAAVLLVWSYFRNGSLWLAFRAYRQGNLPQMKKHLEETKHPSHLSAQSKAYFDMLKGISLAEDERLEESYKSLLAASEGKLRTSNVRSAVEIHLADVAIQMGNYETATRHIAQARGLDHQPALDPFIDDLEHRVTGAG